MTVEDLIRVKELYNMLDKYCYEYFERNGEEWQNYIGWNWSDDDKIKISYVYENYWEMDESFTEVSDIIITYNELIEFVNDKV